ncbi:tRNA lysidine(34) synthetase TilS [Maribacter sp. HTCC2170]|uniref:tRNA lysidine(34) synthetase TilS n=1 Tax=Maribacter sp. (strain HTCC2170 / KCCM 42371) TaxID=313603 RepID=UPI00006B220F|nr:tRNA lysidine(34) synthetase TilS [Maribacter sp. HTCC2170]EAR00233.1 putative cell-cycle protein [Maribacter sp. HTCC2170]
MLNEFREHIENHFPELLQSRFLLACSGGLDSVVLAHLCSELGLDFSLAHCNFKLRDIESDKDERFVKELAEILKVPCFVICFDTLEYANEQGVSIQMAARKMRYEWFKSLKKQHSIKTLVTAHHADDNIETFLINLSRGTGIKGLTGIPSKTNEISRPLLAFSRLQIMEYAKQSNIEWREDQSNKETKYLRNKIRHEIVPRLKELHPTFSNNFRITQKYLRQASDISDGHLNQVKAKLFTIEGELIRIPIEPLKVLKPLDAYLYGLFNEYGFTEWEDVKLLLNAMSGKTIYSKTHRLVKDRDELLLSGSMDKVEFNYEIDESTDHIDVPISLSIVSVNNIEETNASVLYVDKETLKYPLVLRKWQKGDYFYPFGMVGRKKVSKYFKDEKLSLIEKDSQWLLCSSQDIIWVVGRRADDRFRVTSKTKKAVKIILN